MTSSKVSIIVKAASYIVILSACIVVIIPMIWFLSTSFKTFSDATSYPPDWRPKPATLSNYHFVLFGSNTPKYFFNSSFVVLMTILLTLLLASHVAYAAARFNFKLKNAILFVILATTMIPGICILTSLYVIAVKAKMHDTYLVLILVFSAWQIPAQVWLLKGFFEGIPIELEEAAKLDGVSTLKIFYVIVLPLSKPGLAAGMILIFINVWNDWLISATLTISEGMRLINVGLLDYIKDLGVDWGKFTSYALIAIMPILVLFMVLQRHFIQGLIAGATKG